MYIIYLIFLGRKEFLDPRWWVILITSELKKKTVRLQTWHVMPFGEKNPESSIAVARFQKEKEKNVRSPNLGEDHDWSFLPGVSCSEMPWVDEAGIDMFMIYWKPNYPNIENFKVLKSKVSKEIHENQSIQIEK